MKTTQEQVSQLLQQWRAGDGSAAERLVAATYQELRRIARGMMRGERSNHTLQPTALVHEAYLRLFQDEPAELTSRAAFLGLMAAQMKRHLVDHARRRGAEKRGGGLVHENLDAAERSATEPEESPEAFLARLDAALDKLASEFPRVAEIIRLRFVADLSIDATARELGLSTGTVKRDFAFGRVWLIRELGPLERSGFRPSAPVRAKEVSMTKSLLKTIVACLVVTSLASGTAFAQGFFRADRVLGYDTDVWRVWVPAGQVRVTVEAGSHTDVDLRVYDAVTGQLVAEDADDTSFCIGRFYARFSGFVEIHIENLGRSSNGYRLSVN